MLLSGRAGEQRRAGLPPAPSAGERHQPAAQQVADEVLLGDADLAPDSQSSPVRRSTGSTTSPTQSCGAEGRDRLDRSPGAHPRRRSRCRRSRSSSRIAADRGDRSARRVGQPFAAGAQHALGGLGRRRASLDQVQHLPQALFVPLRVEPVAGLGPGRLDDAVAPLPGPQGGRGHTGATRELADPDRGAGRRRGTGRNGRARPASRRPGQRCMPASPPFDQTFDELDTTLLSLLASQLARRLGTDGRAIRMPSTTKSPQPAESTRRGPAGVARVLPSP